MRSILKTLIPFIFGTVIAYPAVVSARHKQALKKDSITLTINFLQAAAKDTLTLRIGEHFVGWESAGPVKKYIALQNTKGRYVFKVPVSGSGGYFDIFAIIKIGKVYQTNQRAITALQFWEAGDKINIEIDNIEKATGIYSKCKFEGNNAIKYTARQELDKLISGFGNIDTDAYTTNRVLPDTISKRLAFYRPKMSPAAFQVLTADLTYTRLSHYLGGLVFNAKMAASDPKARELYEAIISAPKEMPPPNAHRSKMYLRYKMDLAKLYSIFDPTVKGDIFGSIVANNSGIIRDIMMVYYFNAYYKPIDAPKEYSTASRLIKNPVLSDHLKTYRYKLPGLQWADYELTDINGEKVKLSQFDNKIVLLDFWFTGCGYCALYYERVLSRIKKDFEGTDIAFLSISIDRNFNNWKASVASGEYTDESVHNFYTSGLGSDHPIAKENGINGGPYVVLLNKGRILSQYNTQELYNLDQLKSTLTRMLAK